VLARPLLCGGMHFSARGLSHCWNHMMRGSSGPNLEVCYFPFHYLSDSVVHLCSDDE
jgi:hypothetical protein